jgi:3-oxoacyl-[acyl-carrier-protein] synthase II
VVLRLNLERAPLATSSMVSDCSGSTDSPHRVVVTGAGIVTSHGLGWRVNAEAFRTGRTSLPPVTLFDVSGQRVQRAGEVALPASLPPTSLKPREEARLERASRLLIHAAHEAVATAPATLFEGQVPIVLGSSAGGMVLGEAFYREHRKPTRRDQARRAMLYQSQNQGAQCARALGIEGEVTVISNACASGANAIGHAFQLIRSGMAKVALCGGYDALCQLVFAGFDSLKALSPTVARPFDVNRDGLALGEGAGMMLLETLASAEARGAKIIAEITGYGSATDLHHLTQPHPMGATAVKTMTAACRMAGLAPGAVDYINSHGTGTPLNDVAEAQAIMAWAGESAARLAVSSTKGGIGHLLGGAGAVEAVISAMTVAEGFLPPCVSVETPDPACGFDLVRESRAADVRVAMTNSFGFGGSNATLVMQRFSA